MNAETLQLIIDGIKVAGLIIASIFLVLDKSEKGEEITDEDLAELRRISHILTDELIEKLDAAANEDPVS